MDQAIDANRCYYYIEGFVDGKGPEFKYGCFIGLPHEEIVAAYMEYMKKHPSEVEGSKRLSLERALTLFCWQRHAPAKPSSQ
jgi:hypothetical protein